MAAPLFVYKVKGEGEFPIDLLSSQQAWPNSRSDAAAIYDTIRARQLGSLVLTLASNRAPRPEPWQSRRWRLWSQA